MDVLDISLILSILSCSLVAGFIFTYEIVVMPGLSNLNNRDFLRAFQVTDAIIQNKQPLFMFTWVGSILAVLANERLKFETKWNFFNYIRTSIAISVSVLLITILTIR
jgi:uncharacterized membrane protein